jgi:hypothetical protein
MDGNGTEPEEHAMRNADDLTRTVARVVDEVHQCTYELGQLAGELSRIRLEMAEIRSIGIRTMESVQQAVARLQGDMRQTADDSASHKVADLEMKLKEEQLDSWRAKARDDRNNRMLLVIAIVGPVVAALLTHIAHVLAK